MLQDSRKMPPFSPQGNKQTQKHTCADKLLPVRSVGHNILPYFEKFMVFLLWGPIVVIEASIVNHTTDNTTDTEMRIRSQRSQEM